MIWVVLAVLAIGYSFYYNKKNGSAWDYTMPTIFVAVLAAIGVGFASLLATIATSPQPKPAYSVNLRTIADGTGTHGSFFLGSGYLNNEAVFYYYAEVGPKQYRQYSVPADQATIEESTDAKPHAEITTYVRHPNRWFSVFGDMDRAEIHNTYKFVVPDGTIVPNYVLDTSAH